jgi:prepilin-type N-terminal cleavage/methylation domain-containing protein
MKIFLNKNKKECKGFTIIETLVAVAILMISVAGPLTVAHKGLMASIYTRDNVTASYLAQDALEYVKNIRDNHKIQGDYWLGAGEENLARCTSVTAYHCSVDTSAGNPFNGDGMFFCEDGSPTACRLYKNSEGYTMNPDGGTLTPFRRYFYIVPNSISPTTQATLYVVVEWQTGVLNNSVTYKTEIFDSIL